MKKKVYRERYYYGEKQIIPNTAETIKVDTNIEFPDAKQVKIKAVKKTKDYRKKKSDK